jgi:hypothetical protein
MSSLYAEQSISSGLVRQNISQSPRLVIFQNVYRNVVFVRGRVCAATWCTDCPYLTHNTHYLHQDKSKICIPKLVDSRAKVFYDISLVSIGSHEKTCALVQLIFFLTYEFVINLRTDLMFSFFFDLLTVKWSWLYILKNFTSAFLDTKQGFCL